MKPIRLLGLVLVLCAGVLAAAPAAAQEAPGTPQQERVRRDRNALTAEEIQSVPQSNMFDVVRNLRPQWLRTRGDNSMRMGDPVHVYLDGVHLGDATAMQSVDPGAILRVRYLNATSATTQYGSGHTRGAILLFTR